MRFWVITFLFGSILLGGCVGDTADTADDNSLDMIAGNAYQGLLVEADLRSMIRIIDPETFLRVTFFEGDDLSAEVRLSGVLEYRILGIWHEYDDTDTMAVNQLTIEDEAFTGSIVLDGVTLHFDGSFHDERQLLDVEISLIGSMTLDSWEPPPEEESADDDDSGETS